MTPHRFGRLITGPTKPISHEPVKCKYFDSCEHAIDNAFTCNNSGGLYCGTFRIMRTTERLKNAV